MLGVKASACTTRIKPTRRYRMLKLLALFRGIPRAIFYSSDLLLRVILAALHVERLPVRRHHFAEAHGKRPVFRAIAGSRNRVPRLEHVPRPTHPGHGDQARGFGRPFFDLAIGIFDIERKFGMRIHEPETRYGSL